MGSTFAGAGRIGIVGTACVAAVLSLPACTITSHNSDQQELEKRGFSDISNDDGTGVYWATVGTCRVRLAIDTRKKEWTGSITDIGLIDPSAASIRNDHRFDYCSAKTPDK